MSAILGPEMAARILWTPGKNAGPATTQNLVVKFDGEICGGVLVENASDDFSQQEKLENLLPNFAGSSPTISPKTSPTSLWKSLVLKNALFLQEKTHVHKIPRFLGGFWGVVGMGVPILFYGREDFLTISRPWGDSQRESNMHRIEGRHFASLFAPNFWVGENGGFKQELIVAWAIRNAIRANRFARIMRT